MREMLFEIAFHFLLGRPLVCCGNTIYDEKWRINSTEAISPNTNNGSFFRISSLIPVPLSQYAMNMPDSNIFEKYVNALYKKYNEFNLLHVFWLYFYALSSPLHVAGVQFGAAIEAIQKSYNDGHQKKYNNALLDKPKWKEFYDKVLGVIDDLDIAADKASILKNKLSNLNQTPQSLKNEDFFKLLGLELSQLEIDAWQRRNDSAHGNRIEDEDYVKMIKDIKLLKLMFHRILLSMVGNFKYYVDYYSVNYPIRKLQSPGAIIGFIHRVPECNLSCDILFLLILN